MSETPSKEVHRTANEPSSSKERRTPLSEVPKIQTKENIETLHENIRREKRLMANIGYLTTLQQLGDESDLDNIFDGQVSLGEEELLASYALLDILNGNSSFTTLRPPLKLGYERNFARDSSYNIGYETFKNPKTKKEERYLSSISGTTNFTPFSWGDTSLKLHYNQQTRVIESATFERPILANNEEIQIHRNAQGLVDVIIVGNRTKVDNTITIEYKDGLPFSMKQTKYGISEDVTLFSHNEARELSAIIYAPAISVKGFKASFKNANTYKELGKQAEIAFLEALKRSKGVDVVEIQSVDGAPVSTKTKLGASEWYYTDGKSDFEWKNGELSKIHLQRENIIDDRKDILFKY